MSTEANIPGIGRIIYVERPFDEALQVLKRNKASIITAEQLARARIQKGKDHSLSQNGSYVQEGSLFVPNSSKRRIWLRNSLVLQALCSAVDAHRKGQEFFPSNFSIDSFLDALKEGEDYFILNDLTPIQSNRYGEDPRTKWLYGETAQEYGLFLQDAKGQVVNSPIYMNNSNDNRQNPFANQLWLHGLGGDSDIYGLRVLNVNYRVRGVVVKTGEATTKKTELYTPGHIRELKRVLNAQGISGDLEKRIIEGLKK